MNTGYASTYLYLLQCLPSVSYNFPNTGLLHPWLNLFLGNFFFFGATVNGTVSLVSISNSSLLLYKNATDFWILILYPVILLN